MFVCMWVMSIAGLGLKVKVKGHYYRVNTMHVVVCDVYSHCCCTDLMDIMNIDYVYSLIYCVSNC